MGGKAQSARAPQPALSAMDESPVTPLHIRSFLLASAGIMVDGFDLSIISYALLGIVPFFHPSTIELSWVGTAALIGTAIGAALLGRITDFLGRKAMFMFDLLFFVVFALATGLATNMTWLIIFRLLLGIGIGADYPIAASYVAEIIPRKKRGAYLAATIFMWGVGGLIALLFSWVILSVDNSATAWRWLLASGAVPALVVIILRARMPESPRWLLKQKRTEDAAKAMAQLGVASVAASSLQAVAGRATEPYWRLFSGKMLRATLFCTLPWLLYDIVDYGIGVFKTLLMKGLGFHTNSEVLLGSLILSLFGMAASYAGILTIEPLGRVKQQVWGFIGMAVGLVGLGVLSAHGTAGIALGALMLFLGIQSMSDSWGPSKVTYVAPAEVYPTSLRASGHGLASMAAKVGASVGTFLLPLVEKAVGVSNLMFWLAAVCCAGLVVTVVFRVETAGGESLEAIEARLLEEDAVTAEVAAL